MGRFIQKEFNEFIIDNGLIGFLKEPIRLKSGRLSNWYINWRNAAEDVYLFDRLTDYVIAFVEEQGLMPDCFYGVPEGATKLSIITQYKWAKKQLNYGPGVYQLAMGRGRPKEHGDPKDRYFIGAPKARTVVLEDVTTTGDSLIKTIDILLEAGVSVIASIGLTNRNEIRDDKKIVNEVVESTGVRYYAMSNALELLPQAYRRLQPGEIVARHVEEYFKRYGAEEIKLV